MNALSEISKIIPQITNLFSLCAFIILIIALIILAGKNPPIDTINKLLLLALLALLPKVYTELIPHLKPRQDVTLDVSKVISLPGNYQGTIDATKADAALIQPGEYSLEISEDLVCILISKRNFKTFTLGKIEDIRKSGNIYQIPTLGDVKFEKVGLRTEVSSIYSFTQIYKIAFSKYE